jgi:hypothetical protein
METTESAASFPTPTMFCRCLVAARDDDVAGVSGAQPDLPCALCTATDLDHIGDLNEMVLYSLAHLADTNHLVGFDDMLRHYHTAFDAGSSAPRPPAASSPGRTPRPLPASNPPRCCEAEGVVWQRGKRQCDETW